MLDTLQSRLQHSRSLGGPHPYAGLLTGDAGDSSRRPQHVVADEVTDAYIAELEAANAQLQVGPESSNWLECSSDGAHS